MIFDSWVKNLLLDKVVESQLVLLWRNGRNVTLSFSLDVQKSILCETLKFFIEIPVLQEIDYPDMKVLAEHSSIRISPYVRDEVSVLAN